MNTKDFIRLGVPLGEATRRATDFVAEYVLSGGDKSKLEGEVKAIINNPAAYADDPLRKEFAKAITNAPPPPRAKPVKYRQWGEGLEHDAVMQMEKACLLPVSVAGALMPDAHVGYGLPIGGVLATEKAVIPYAVGVDIACRMKMTILNIPIRDLENKQDRLTRAIEAETRFGVGAMFRDRRAHEVLDADWTISPVTKQNKDRAWSQLGTSGSGNHFVEFGLFTAHSKINDLEPGMYVALLSHSGSRGTGAAVCDYYSKLAFAQFKDLPSELKRLAWLSLDSQEGQEYWNAMELMGRYAAAIERALRNSGQSSYAIRHLLEAVPEVQEVVSDPMVRCLVESVLGPKAFVVRSIFFDKTPEANWKVAWHQDLTIAVREKIEGEGFSAWSVKEGVVHVQPPISVLERMVTVRLHLNDCGTDNGALQVMPKSHNAGRLTGDQISAWRLREKPIPCVVPRGGALLMRPLLLHASSSATAPTHRRVVHLEFSSDSLSGGLEWVR